MSDESKGNRKNPLEEGAGIKLDFGKLKAVAACGRDVMPVAVQDADTGRVLIVAYADETALRHSLEKGEAAFWSTSRNELWVKGRTSGDILKIVEIRVNCEQNSLLYLVRPTRTGACHTRDSAGNTRPSCYYRRIEGEGLEFVD